MNHGFELFYISNKNEIWWGSNEGSFHKNNHFIMTIFINCNCVSKIEAIKYIALCVFVLIAYF